jgi:ribose transport system ATP-binding protein
LLHREEASVTVRQTSLPRHGDEQAAPVLLAANGISKDFSGVRVLSAIDLGLRKGEIHALMGENGAGKSTLVKILSGVHVDYEGAIRVDGRPARFAGVRDAELAGIAMIHQELNLVPELSVAENIFLGREPLLGGLIVDGRRMMRAAHALLARLGIELDAEIRVGRLRVGEQQLVEIAKALSLDARILIMDEPTSALSAAECATLFKVVRQLAGAGVAIVYISHRIEEVVQLADRVTVLRDGRRVLTALRRETSPEAIIAAMVGREMTHAERTRSAAEGPVVLEVEDLTLDLPTRRGWRRVLGGVSFALRQGEILGIGGLLGAGRTEILETIFGVDRGRRGGRIRLDGKPVAIGGPADACRLGIAFVSEDRKAQGLHLAASIQDNIVLPSLATLSPFGLRTFAREADLARDLVAKLSIRCTSIEQPTATLSGGNQQKVVIGKWLATRPRVLLLDEPTRGIDVGAKREIYELIFALAADGLGIVVVTSELPELLLLADRILVMCEGQATGLLPRRAATQEAVMRLATPRGHGGAGRAVA